MTGSEERETAHNLKSKSNILDYIVDLNKDLDACPVPRKIEFITGPIFIEEIKYLKVS